MQLVEVVMSSDTAGAAKAFWAPAQTGIYGGFQPGDENDFTMLGDSAVHHYYLPIATSSAPTIYQLRLDVPPGATVAIQSVALANLVAPSGRGGSPSWQFSSSGSSLGWIPYQGVVDMSVSGGGLQLQTYANSTLLAPAAQVTNQLEWFSLIGDVTQTSLETPWVQFNFASTANSGASSSAYFPVIADSAQHIYNVNVGGASGWWSTVSRSPSRFPRTPASPSVRCKSGQRPKGRRIWRWTPAARLRRSHASARLSRFPAASRIAARSRCRMCRPT